VAKIAIIRNARLEQSQGAPGKSLIVDIDSHGSDNSEFYQIPGIFHKPQDDTEVVIVDCSGNNIAIAGHDYKFDEEIEKGETLIYSVDAAGVLKGKILIDKTGNIILNDGTDFAVAYTDLKSAFDTLKGDLNNLISVFNSHVHPGVTAGGASTAATVTPGTASAADMSGSKVAAVKLP
jgi:hypothetical protein